MSPRQNLLLLALSGILIALGVVGATDSMSRWRDSHDFDGYRKFEPDERKLVMIAGGDINVGRNAGATLDKVGVEGALGDVMPILRQGDLLFGNLECVLTKSIKSRNKGKGTSWLIKAPPENVKYLEQIGFDVLHLANNHMGDYLCTGIKDTVRTLRRKGLFFGGAGHNLEAAKHPVIVERNGLKIAFIFMGTTAAKTAAKADKCGIYYYDLEKDIDEARLDLRKTLRHLRPRMDVVLLSIHWGVPFQRGQLNESMVAFGHMAIDEGIQGIMGHGNHELIGMERYRGRPIVYDMGNFYFDMDDVPWVNRQGYWRWEISRAGVDRVGFTPYVLDRKNMIAQIPETSLAKTIYERVAQSTASRGSRTYREGSWLYLQ